jgi:hypothetical protein
MRADFAQQAGERLRLAEEDDPLGSHQPSDPAPGEGTKHQDQQERGRSEDRDLNRDQPVGGRADTKEDPEGERANQQRVKEIGDIVEGTVIDALDIAFVQPVGPKEQDPDGQGRQNPEQIRHPVAGR